jgi:hypothetical protein
MYHCHVEATEHMQMGMLGNLYVTPMQDNDVELYPKADGTLYKGFAYNDGDGSTGYDVDYPIQLGGFDPLFHDASLTTQPLPFALMDDKYPMINGRGYPDTVRTGSLVPSQGNSYIQGATVVNNPGPKVGSFHVSGGGLEETSSAYSGLDIVFTSGALNGTVRRILEYNVTQQGNNTRIEIVTASDLPAKPASGDSFDIGRVSQKVDSLIKATQGQKILLRLSNLNVTRFHTLACTLPMKVVGADATLLRGPDGKDLSYTTTSITLGGGKAVDAIIDTTDVAPGTYLLYATNLNCLSNNQEDFGGMMTEIVVTSP